MTKFCTNCGKQNEGTSAFCSNCGSPLQAPAPQPQLDPEQQTTDLDQNVETTEAKPKTVIDKLLVMLKTHKSIAMLIGGIALAVIVAAIVISALFPSPQAVVKKYIKGIESGNAKMIVDCMPSFYWEDDKDEKEDLIDNLEDSLDDMDIDSISYKIKKVKDLDDDDIEEYEDTLESMELWYDEFDADDVTDFKSVKVKVTLEYDDEKESETTEFILIKYKGQWKIFRGGLY